MKWIIENSAKQWPKLALEILASVVISVLGVRLALSSRDVIDVATGARTGSFSGESIKLFSIVLFQLVICQRAAYAVFAET